MRGEPLPSGELEMVVPLVGAGASDDVFLYVFPGSAGRACPDPVGKPVHATAYGALSGDPSLRTHVRRTGSELRLEMTVAGSLAGFSTNGCGVVVPWDDIGLFAGRVPLKVQDDGWSLKVTLAGDGTFREVHRTAQAGEGWLDEIVETTSGRFVTRLGVDSLDLTQTVERTWRHAGSVDPPLARVDFHEIAQLDWSLDCPASACTGSVVPVSVNLDGPGTVLVGDSVGCSAPTCDGSAAKGAETLVRVIPTEPKARVAFSGCPGRTYYDGVHYVCAFTPSAAVTMSVSVDPIVSYAPWAQYEPKEKNWPADPRTFVRRSSLDWANPDGYRGGGSKRCPTKDERIAARGSVKAAWLAKGTYSHVFRYCAGRGNSIKKKQRFTTKQLTAPSEKSAKPKLGGSGRWGFYLNVDDDEWPGIRPPSERGGRYANAPDMMVEYAPHRYIVYWFFSARNNVRKAFVDDVHEGDWERIAVRLDENNIATSVGYWQHYCDADTESRSKLVRDDSIVSLTHPRVYVARGSHASYQKPGYTAVSCAAHPGGADSHRGGGVTWETWQRGSAGFRDVTREPWYGFGGGWGSKTATGDDGYWGPLGPGPKKPAAPKGW